MNTHIHVVIVTYNRLDKLKHTLECYDRQTYPPQEIIVVDNHSSDKTAEYLEDWSSQNSDISKIVITTEYNLGGAGGFAIGMQEALKHGAEWIWISDDDAYPDSKALEITAQYCNKLQADTVCVCGSVIHQGEVDIDHRRISKGKIIKLPVKIPKEAYTKEVIDIDETTFVGSCFKADTVRKAGVPLKDFFIYFDDTEFSHRMAKYGKIRLVPEIIITHDTVTYSQPTDVVATWRDYYLVRNHVNTLKRHQLVSYCAYCIKKIYDTAVSFTRNKNTQLLAMNLHAIYDGMTGHLGLHPIYKPGYNIPA